MRVCPNKCENSFFPFRGDKFCCECGVSTIEIKEDAYRCKNLDCITRSYGDYFTDRQKFCGHCGSPIILIRSDEDV